MYSEISPLKKVNQPSLDSGKFASNFNGEWHFKGVIHETIHFIEEMQMLNPELWFRFVQQFRLHTDTDNGWRGEYWGKMMRGACFVYSYTRNNELYNILTQTVRDMLDSFDEYGRISTYPIEKEFNGWDIWCRKYVLLGMQYYLEICNDDKLIEKIVAGMCKQVDAIMSKIGRTEDGKRPITEATSHWRGLNSSSLLEPIVRLYNLTKEKKYFDFAEYIVQSGGTSVENVFELAYENNLYPYQYPVTKAYEMISCFEGLLEFYRVTKNERYKTAIINFADRILESDFTVIGCSGCTHELFDHSTVRQSNTTNGNIMQETCVTVTLMKFFYQLTLLTGNSKYVDAFERSLYNAYLGSVNTEKRVEPSIQKEYPELHFEPLPFDSYSPLTSGTRGNGIGGFKIMPDNHYYGCCACIGAAGAGLVPKMAVLKSDSGIVLNLYIPGTIKSETPSGNPITIINETDYPRNGKMRITISLNTEEEFTIMLRNPQWSKNTYVTVNGENAAVYEGYIEIHRIWKDGDVIEMELDMRTQAVFPIPYGQQILMNKVIWGHNYIVPTFDREDPLAKTHIALRRGPLMLAVDKRLGTNPDNPISIDIGKDGYVNAVLPESDMAPYPHIVEVCIPTKDHSYFRVTDYASAGKLWTEESKMAVWIRAC